MVNTILVPLDGSAQSWEALDFAVAQFTEAEITAIHVIASSKAMYSDSMGGFYGVEQIEHAKEDDAEELLVEARERAEMAGLDTSSRFDSVIETGPPARTIVEYIEEHAVDHVVMGSRGRTGIKRILLGSVAEDVTRRSPVPVTIVR